MATLIINKLLCFVSSQADKLPFDSLYQTIQDLYSIEEVTKVKQVLLLEFDKNFDPELVK